MLLSDFAKACFLGAFDIIKMGSIRFIYPLYTSRTALDLHTFNS